MSVKIELSKEALERANKLLSGVSGGLIRATSAAMKRAGASGKTAAGRHAAAVYTIRKGDFMRNVTVKQHVADLGGVAQLSISFAGNVMPLMTFESKVDASGRVRTRVKRESAVTTLDHAFQASVGGHDGIYERYGASRLPIQQKYGPSTAHMMADPNVVEQMEATVVDAFEKRIDHEVLRILNGWGG